jgi:hypothetical protein
MHTLNAKLSKRIDETVASLIAGRRLFAVPSKNRAANRLDAAGAGALWCPCAGSRRTWRQVGAYGMKTMRLVNSVDQVEELAHELPNT